MPDWHRLVAEKIDRVELTPLQKEEVAAELAGHLEELYEEQRALGLPDSEAVDRALSEVCDWSELKRRVQRAKREEGIMNDRTKRLWLPGLVSFTLAMACEIGLRRSGPGALTGGPMFYSHVTQFVPVGWLVAQVCCGAAGAFLSRRAGGERSARLAAALFTSGILLVTMFIVISICVIGRATGLAFAALDVTILIKPVVTVIVFPSVAMLVGALPFLRETKNGAAA